MDLDTAMESIYEAAVVPDRWPAVLDMVAGVAGAVGTILIADDQRNPRWLNSPSLDGFLHDFMAGDWGKVDSRMPRLLGANHAGFLLEEDVYTPEEIARDALIHGFLRPRGFGWATATAFQTLTGDNLIFSVERRYADGPVPRTAVAALDRIRPHLGRAAMLSARLGLSRARATVDTLADFGMPAGVLARNARLHAANDRLEPLIPSIVQDTRERIAFADPSADTMLAHALDAEIGRMPQSIPIAARPGQPAYVAHLLPVRGAAQDIFSGGTFILALTPAVPSSGPPALLLQGLFDLTAAEARVLRSLAGGTTVTEIAAGHGIGVATVRSQIKAIFAKTGMKRQIDLVRLVSGLSLAPEAGSSRTAGRNGVAPAGRRALLS